MEKVLLELLETGESERLEFKSGRVSAALTDAVARTACAFLNAHGGIILIGVTDDGKVEGVVRASNWASSIRRNLSERIHPWVPLSVTVETLLNKEVIVVVTPIGSERPYNYKNRIYVRHGPSTLEITRAELGTLLRAPMHEGRWERQPALGTDLHDLDQSELAETQHSILKRQNIPIPKRSTKLNFLRALRLAEGDLLLNSALLLFGKDPTARYPQTGVALFIYHSTSDSDSAADAEFLKCNAFEALRKIEQFLDRHDVTSHQESGTNSNRIPQSAAREAALNAIIHRDYAAYSGGMSVTVYSDRVEFWNSGTLPPEIVSDATSFHISMPTNPDITNVFFLRGFVERSGLGTQLITRACLKAGLPRPQWKQEKAGVRLILWRQKKRVGE